MADLKKNGKTGTPVTPESFAVWQEKKRKRKAEAARVSSRDDAETFNLLIVDSFPPAHDFYFLTEIGGARNAEEKRWKRFGCFVRACAL